MKFYITGPGVIRVQGFVIWLDQT